MFIALYQSRGEVGGYTLEDALAFTFITQGIAALLALWGSWPIAESVQTGEVATDLSRPYDYQFAWLAQDYGRAAFQFVARSTPPFSAVLFCELEPDGSVGTHQQQRDPELVLGIDGRGEATVQGIAEPLEPGSVVYVPFGATLSLRNLSPDAPLRYLIIKAATAAAGG